ncbi:hypothetical protein D3C71_25460 [compost metagenome]
MSMPLHVYVGPFLSISAPLSAAASKALRQDDDFSDQLVHVTTEGGQHAWIPNIQGFGKTFAEDGSHDSIVRITLASLSAKLQRFGAEYAGLLERVLSEHGVQFNVEYGAIPYHM